MNEIKLKELIIEIATSMFFYNVDLGYTGDKPLAALNLKMMKFESRLLIIPIITGELDENKPLFDFVKNEEDKEKFEFRTQKVNIRKEFYNTILTHRVLLNSLCKDNIFNLEYEEMTIQDVFGFKCIFEFKINNDGLRVV